MKIIDIIHHASRNSNVNGSLITTFEPYITFAKRLLHSANKHNRLLNIQNQYVSQFGLTSWELAIKNLS